MASPVRFDTMVRADKVEDAGDVPVRAGGSAIAAAAPCFLRGTMIGTTRGEVAVEELAAGDAVSVMEGGRAVSRLVKWVGRGRVALDPAHADADAFPVRIRTGAFRAEVPHRDLLVTSGHCVLVDGVLVPVRMLVNERSITVAREIPAFEFFHVELAGHGILVAEGLETGSYLDTGDRGRFDGAGPTGAVAGAVAGASGAGPARRRNGGTAAPLVVERAVVEPIRRRLAARADALGLAAAPGALLAGEPELRLVTENGMEIAPSLVDGRSYAFVVPGGVRAVRLRSRSARPADTAGRLGDDRRELGVRVGRISVSEGRRRLGYDAHLTTETLSGWHGLEAGAEGRWTDGDASLRLDPERVRNRPVFLDIEVLAAGPYRRAVA